MHGLIAKHGQLAGGSAISAGSQLSKRIDHVLVDISVIEFMLAIVGQKKIDGFGNQAFVVGVAERAADEHGSTVPDVGGNHIAGQLAFSVMPQHGIDGVGEVLAGIDECPVKVKNQQFDLLSRDGAVSLNHPSSFYLLKSCPRNAARFTI